MLSDSENPQHLELHEPPKAGRCQSLTSTMGEEADTEVVCFDMDTEKIINLYTRI